ncbi:hypothetical protein TRIUR3_32410 [Triticum urartu]|uniref:F-box domain-containing protein n=1 Tax=Triticum urartu TaxID=4572 RepID=M8AX55_TRIUA|nr:uncharacterized protein LOC125555741 [Triticum urartu]EMS65679.1 hypothetical protein TRIUR3_32410 [Triticum urartu]
MDQTQRLPEDVLADVLRCLPPRSLAAARCVCRSWHAIVDAHRLLDRDLLPLSLAGFLINFCELDFTEFFFHPSAIRGYADLHFMPTDDISVEDVCNGLVLLDHYVVNPATRCWASLPPRPSPPLGFELFYYERNYIVFDPTVSPHYQVLRFLHVPPRGRGLDAETKQQQWPPSPYMMHVFSSETTRWEERSFIRQGDALGTLADMLLPPLPMPDELYAVYWHGEIYVHCHFVMRISLSSGTYQAIKLPTDVDQHRWAQVLLGRSEKGLYFAALDGQCQLRVWILTELPCDQSEWLLKHDNNLHQIPPPQNYDPQVHRPCWIMADINPAIYSTVKDKLELNSDHGIIFETRLEGHRWDEHIKILGFHPYKEIIYFSETLNRGYAYHLDELKLEDLGNMRPKRLNDCYNKELERSIPYTPCLLGP